MAQFGRVLEWGSRGRWFESSHSDQIFQNPHIYADFLFSVNSVHDFCTFLCKRQMIHTFTPSNQNVTIGSGGDANETFTGRVERNH